MEYVRHESRLNERDDKGVSYREHLEGLARRGKPDAIRALNSGPEMPACTGYLYAWFMQLAASRRQGMNGLERITFSDIDAWSRLTGNQPESHEVDALLMIDFAFLYPGKADV